MKYFKLLLFILGLYRWEDSHREAAYTNWAFDEPTNSESENCVRKTFHIGYEGWHDVDCHLAYEDGFGEQHALCQAFNDGKICILQENNLDCDESIIFRPNLC